MTVELLEAKSESRPQVPLAIIFSSYFLVGLTSFGMAILQKLKTLVMNNQWLSEEEMNDGLAMVFASAGKTMAQPLPWQPSARKR